MTDFNKIAEDAKNLGIHISPEGAEETVVLKVEALLTRTANGRSRIYCNGQEALVPKEVKQEQIERTFWANLAFLCHIKLDPAGAIESLFNIQNKGKDK